MKNQNKKGQGWHEKKREVLTEKGIKNKAPKHREAVMKEKYCNTLRTPLAPCNAESQDENEQLVDETMESVQENRTESAKAKDESRTARKVGSKKNAEDLVEWVQEPTKSDLKDVDTGEAEEEK